MPESWQPTNENLGYSEKEAAYDLCTLLAGYLPALPVDKDGTEWGAEIFRWHDEVSWKYSFMPIVPGVIGGRWQQSGKPPAFDVEVVGFAHTHPNNSPHSTQDLRLALGKSGEMGFKRMQIVYVVNHNGAFWYDGRPEPGGTAKDTPWLKGDARYGALWGDLQGYLMEVKSGKWQ
jgi:hypothetical protein